MPPRPSSGRAVARLLPQYPDIRVELAIDHGLTDIVAERYDAGVRLGEQVAKDMIAVRIGPDLRMAVVGSPAYFDRHRRRGPRRTSTAHHCINLRLPTFGGLYAWEFEKDGRELRARVEGQLIFNSRPADRRGGAGRAGAGLPARGHRAGTDLADRRLVRALGDWCPPFPGYHLYYPSRRQSSPAFALLVEALRYRA